MHLNDIWGSRLGRKHEHSGKFFYAAAPSNFPSKVLFQLQFLPQQPEAVTCWQPGIEFSSILEATSPNWSQYQLLMGGHTAQMPFPSWWIFSISELILIKVISPALLLERDSNFSRDKLIWFINIHSNKRWLKRYWQTEYTIGIFQAS